MARVPRVTPRAAGSNGRGPSDHGDWPGVSLSTVARRRLPGSPPRRPEPFDPPPSPAAVDAGLLRAAETTHHARVVSRRTARTRPTAPPAATAREARAASARRPRAPRPAR